MTSLHGYPTHAEVHEENAPFPITIEQVRYERNAVEEELKKVNLDAGGDSSHASLLKVRHKTLCELHSYYIAYQQACKDLKVIPEYFRATDEAAALDDIEQVLKTRHDYTKKFKARLDEAHSVDLDSADCAAYRIRYDTLEFEGELLESFRNRFTRYFRKKGPRERDLKWLDQKLRQHRNNLRKKVKDLFAALPPLNPFDDAYTTDPHPGNQDRRSHSLPKSRYHPVSRREALLQ
ncbi:hypothetical protein JCM16303_004211 [Sporobolomyces ruberrimus]